MMKWVVPPVVAAIIVGIVAWPLIVDLVPPTRAVDSDWTCHRNVAHALGSWDGIVLSNSLEALLESRARGFRVFEVDLEFTTDSVLVATHDWPRGPRNYAEFRDEQREAGYTPLTFEELAAIFADWPDSYLILDTKSDPVPVWREAERIARAVLPDTTARLIPQLYTPTREAVRESASFERVLLTLYRTGAPDWFILWFMRRSGIDVLTAPPSRLNDQLMTGLHRSGVRVYTHTINDPATAVQLNDVGVHGIYSDSLCCSPYAPPVDRAEAGPCAVSVDADGSSRD